MAMTKAEAAKLTNDLLLRGVVETIVKESSVLQLLPFMEVTGTSVTYNREASMPAATFFDVGDTWTESTPTFTQITANLKILGGDADVDNFIQATYADPNDIEAEVVSSRAKSIAHLFSDSFFNGDSGLNPKTFDGLNKVLNSTAQEVTAGANGAQLTLDMMDQMIDLVMPGKPDAIFLSRRTRRKLSSLRRASGNLLEVDVDQFGQRALFYDGSRRCTSTTSSAIRRCRDRPAGSARRSTRSSSDRAWAPSDWSTAASRSNGSASWKPRTPPAGASSGTPASPSSPCSA